MIRSAAAIAICLLMPSVSAAAAEPGGAATGSSALSPKVSKHIAKILSQGDGKSKATAFKVSSVDDEYVILHLLGLKPNRQSLVVDKNAYDLMAETNPATGETQEFWFDISRFFGRY